jgi:hypothetical protein
MSANVAAPTLFIIFVCSPASRLEGISISLGVAKEPVRWLGVIPVAPKIENAVAVKHINQTVDVF